MPFPRKFGTIPLAPNADSTKRTPASVMLDMHWENMRLVERWSWERYVRLCKFLSYTPWELASLVLLPHDQIERFRRTSCLSGKAARPVALILTLVEAHVMGNWTDDVIKNAFPKLPDGATDNHCHNDEAGVRGVPGTVKDAKADRDGATAAIPATA